MHAIPIHIITGFLGAGKTTAILRLMQNKPVNESWSIIINEFGKIAIDKLILEENATGNNNLTEIVGGCICCSSRELFEQHLQQIIEEQTPDRILVEPTGLGGIDMVQEIITHYPKISLTPVICLIDPDSINNPRIRLNQIYLAQIKASDIVLVSKCDIEENNENSNKVLNWLRQEFPDKRYYGKIRSGIISFDLLQIDSRSDKIAESDSKLSILGPISKDESYKEKCYSFSSYAKFNSDMLVELLAVSDFVVRAKGYIRTVDGWRLLQSVMGKVTIENAISKPENSLVFIFNSEDSAHIEKFSEKLQDCID